MKDYLNINFELIDKMTEIKKKLHRRNGRH